MNVWNVLLGDDLFQATSQHLLDLLFLFVLHLQTPEDSVNNSICPHGVGSMSSMPVLVKTTQAGAALSGESICFHPPTLSAHTETLSLYVFFWEAVNWIGLRALFNFETCLTIFWTFIRRPFLAAPRLDCKRVVLIRSPFPLLHKYAPSNVFGKGKKRKLNDALLKNGKQKIY